MAKIKPKKIYSKNYTTGLKIVGGAAIVTTVIIGSYFAYQSAKPKPITQPTSNTKTQTAAKPKNVKPNLNGKYVGTSGVAQGLSEVTVTITGNTLSGSAVYIGPNKIRIPGIKITGTVTDNSTETQAKGNIQGTFTGSGNVLGQSLNVNGNYMGHIINTSMNVSYSAVTSVGTYPGQITLSKQ